jgi:hypothetical protein
VTKQCFTEAELLRVGCSDYRSEVFQAGNPHQSTFLQVVTRSGYENIRKSINLFVTNSGRNQTHPNGQEDVAETEMHD